MFRLSKIGAVSALFLFASNIGAAPKKAAEAKVPALIQARAQSVLSPQFFFKKPEETVEAGSAFITRHPKTGAFVLCTAAHVFFHEANGMEKDSDPWKVTRVVAEDGTGAKVFGASAFPQKKLKNEDYGEDFVAFKVTKRPPFAFRLAKKVRIGETVWVLGPTIYKGKATHLHDNLLSVRTEDKNAFFSGYSGAPIVNSRGEIVGMVNTGGDGDVIGLSCIMLRSLFP